MKNQRLIHALALLGIVIEAAMSIRGFLPSSTFELWQLILCRLIATAFWGLLLWKVWMVPRRWGLGVGIFLIVVFTFQTYLWVGAIGNPRIAELGIDLGIKAYILHELPLFVGGVCCILLRWCYSNGSTPAQ